MHPFVERILLLHRLGRRISEAGTPDQDAAQEKSVDDIPVRELLEQAERIASSVAKREHLKADDEKAILAAAFLAVRRREKKSAPTPATPKSYLLLA